MNFFKKKLKKEINKNDSFINPEVLEVNLVKDEISLEFNWRKHLFSFFLTLFVAGLFVAEVYYGLDWWQKQEEEKTVALNSELQKITSQVKKINSNAKDFTSFKDKLLLTKQLADNHIYWTDFFNWLEKNTLNSVSYGGFSGSTDGKYNLTASAKTFADISWQVKAFKNDPFTNSATVDSGSSGRSEDVTVSSESPISFSIDLEVKPQIFYRQAQ